MRSPRSSLIAGKSLLTGTLLLSLSLLTASLAPAALATGDSAEALPAAASERTAGTPDSPSVAADDRYILRLTSTADRATIQRRITALGGSIVRFQQSLDTVVVTVPSAARAALTDLPGVLAAVADTEVRAQSLGFDPGPQPGSMTNVTRITGATEMWKKGFTGKGIDVALLDTGVAPVSGLLDPTKVVIGPDLSFESQNLNTRYLDSYGHGTNMAGIIAGREVAAGSGTSYAADTTTYYGMAPDARLISLKLADHGGAVDVSQMIAAVDWVVSNRWKSGLNIRVLNISYGNLSKQNAQLDPLSWATEQAWKLGIVVVASAGNDGDTTVGLASPAYNPWVIAVGAQDAKGTTTYADDIVPSFSERGLNNGRGPDLVAPGVGVISLGVPGSYLQQTYPSARVGNGFLRGSGTSQAAAVVSGAVALLLQQHGWLTPDGVKAQLTSTATALTATAVTAQGAGALNLRQATTVTPIPRPQIRPLGNGFGTLEAARGGRHLQLDGVALTGEKDIMLMPWDSIRLSAPVGTWLWDGTFNGSVWAGTDFTADSATWAGKTWQGKTWQGKTWQGKTWQTAAWTGSGWNSAAWSGPVPTPSWAGKVWSSAGWN